MKIFTNCAKFYGEDLDVDQVDGGSFEICVDCEEDYMVVMAYVASCHPFNRVLNLATFDCDRVRNNLVDLFLRLLMFN